MPRHKLSQFEANLREAISKNLKRVSRGVTQQQLSQMTGIPASTLSGYFSQRSTPNPGAVQKIADALGINKSDIDPRFTTGITGAKVDIVPIYNQLYPARQEKVYNYANDQLKQQQNENVISLDDERQERQPMLLHIAGTVSAGTGEYLPDDDTGDDIPFSGPVPDYDFALRVNGDSMEPMFEDGQIIFVKKCDDCDVHSGQIVIADLNGDAYVKKIDIQPDGVRLISLNPKYKPILVESFDDFAIQGIVML